MNPLLHRLQPYPFERLRKLFEGITPNPAYRSIRMGIGEPQHDTPEVIRRAMVQAIERHPSALANYPATQGESTLRAACAGWVTRRYGVDCDPATQVLPVNGSREALFSLAQAVFPSSASATSASSATVVLCPNPFYQIYEGAALLAGAEVHYVPSVPARNFATDWESIPETIWERTALVFVCSPNNPTGAVMPMQEWELLFERSDRYGFVIASDECYSEIYFRDEPPLGGLQAAYARGRTDFRRLVMLTSLSKRSSTPGLRSGFVAGDADILSQYLHYRTYHGCAMGTAVQAASIAAWSDEAHVVENRALYRQKFAQVLPILQDVLDVSLPDAGFYLWAGVGSEKTPQDETLFARDLFASYNVTVLPGSYLARSVGGHNPGSGRVRLALVASVEDCVDAARRIREFVLRR
ncbi:succinyldiaminopimelate transaminase [Candidatus Symbiobacter mobilis]|uniref:N-succinyldiaminopimelate aminotransferase n=1 Tax=Candidatus Symbiobacter mobilis CR TaxID=946483 RepID=U5N578_9BURK|nr:succinyldiaminopimelate transaminase [Candidatus Symbiobacter mobilis]AGX86676.1 N-succinyldiaminopimelate aminotransferase [Candidatus Symbiobacter mobilis CR]